MKTRQKLKSFRRVILISTLFAGVWLYTASIIFGFLPTLLFNLAVVCLLIGLAKLSEIPEETK